MSYIEGGRIGTTGFECSICYGGTHGLYDKEMMDEQLKSQLQHHIVVEEDSNMHELSEMCAVGHMCCTKCHKSLLLLPRKACPTCRGKLLPIDSRKIRLYSHEDAVKMERDSDSAQSRADARKVEFEASMVAGVVVVDAVFANAIEDQNESVVFQLLLDGVNAKACLENGLPLVLYAVCMNYWNIVIMLLHAGAHATASSHVSNESLVCMAIRACNTKAVKCLLKDYMISANSISPEGKHLVIEAANAGHWVIVFLLLDNSARIASQSLQSESVVDIAFRNSNYQAIKELMTRKAEVDLLSSAVKNSLVNAASSGQWSCVFVLLDASVCLMACNSENESLLYIAVCTYHTSKIEKLLQTYAVPADSLSPTGEPLTIQAAMLGHWAIVFLLLDNGARISSQSLQSESVVDIAFRTSNYEAIKELMTRKAEVDLLSSAVKNSLTNAASSGLWSHVFDMLDASVCLIACNSENESLLYIAVRENYSGSVKKLLQKYAVLADSPLPSGKPLTIEAAMLGHWAIVFILLNNGASTACLSL